MSASTLAQYSARARRRVGAAAPGIASTLASVSRPSVRWSRCSQNLNSAAPSRSAHSASPVAIRQWMAARKLSCSTSQQRSHASRSAGLISRVSSSASDEHVGRVGALGRRGLAVLEQPLPAVLAERLEHDEARLAVLGRPLHEQAVVHERGDAVQDVDAQVLAGIADGLRGLERAASGEHRQAAKELLLGRRQQVVAPLDRLAQRLLAFRQVARPAGQQLERPFDARQQLARAAGS